MKTPNLLIISALILLSLLLSSCANQSKNNDDAASTEAASSEVQTVSLLNQLNEFTDNGALEIVPVYGSHYDHNKGNYSCDGCFAVKDSLGQFVAFDDNTDYADFCATLCFISRVFKDYAGQNDIDYWGSYPQDSLNNINTCRDEVILGVENYIKGDKDLISSETLAGVIEKNYSELKPQNWIFKLTSNNPGDKSYKSINPEITPAVNAFMQKEYIIRHKAEDGNAIITADGEPLPENALVLLTF